MAEVAAVFLPNVFTDVLFRMKVLDQVLDFVVLWLRIPLRFIRQRKRNLSGVRMMKPSESPPPWTDFRLGSIKVTPGFCERRANRVRVRVTHLDRSHPAADLEPPEPNNTELPDNKPSGAQGAKTSGSRI